MYEHYFDDFVVGHELDKVEASKSGIIKYCDRVIDAAMNSRLKWMQLREEIEAEETELGFTWFKAVAESCGFCKEFKECDACFVKSACRKSLKEIHKGDVINEGTQIERSINVEAFHDMVSEIIAFLDRVISHTIHYKHQVADDIVGRRE
jgi:hypothetical protein